MKSMLMIGDAVFYCGQKFRQELCDKGGTPLKGWIHGTVKGEEDVFVVEFSEAKDGDYIMHASVLTQWKPPKDKQVGPDIQPRRKRASEDE